MRAVVQRVSQASVSVAGATIAKISRGFLVLLGVEQGDSEQDAALMADKIAGLRIFPDAEDKMNLALSDIGGSILLISQFTLLGDCRKGRRPSFVAAASPELGNQLYELCADYLSQKNIPVERGIFRANMQVSLVNDGPVTLLVDSRKNF
ncbi:MAG TPA: D-aminoacyl-tRNA deacylase [Pirellulaceae bacterium]|nr:D-aminoacyl-tRNA deacylase [Pirellulaceae bacterium]HMO92841.1 D-aminoacyl-tRNA deacylase [Pirellulaceae bacterium]HMP69417.1 D-aminoacyl-tRNA deacylase [Pirellulaceae bacterium]